MAMRKIQLFIISLWLLFPLLAIREFRAGSRLDFSTASLWAFARANAVSLCSILLLVIGLYFLARFMFLLKGSTMLPKTIKKIEDQNYEHLAFLTTYIVPFLRVKLEGRDLIITVLILLIIAGIFIRTNLFYKNPTLALLGYRLYKVDTEVDKGLILISRQQLRCGDRYHYIHLADNVYFAKI